ncbi:MAG: hypothetical protein K2Q12_09565 [Rickettsiales bacterium]|nr:hypothetical protein [Rickettsiales bacterium]
MVGDDLDYTLAQEREKLAAFQTEVRGLFSQLSQEIEVDFTRLVNRLVEQQQSLTEGNSGLLTNAASQSLAQSITHGFHDVAGRYDRNGNDSIIGRALQAALGGIAGNGQRTNRLQPRTILRRIASVFGTGLGNELAEGLGFEPPASMRLSRHQSALEQGIRLQKAQRNQ